MIQKHQHEILLVEDSPSDAMLAMRALLESSFNSRVNHAKDGVEALAMLRGELPHDDCPRPDLILLDLNMPRKDGRQVLDELRRDADLSTIPVVVLSTSAQDSDIYDCYQLGSNSFIVKPVELQDFFRVMEKTQDYWFRMCALPTAK